MLRIITNDQSRLNYEQQSQYRIRIEFSNETNTIEKDFLIDIEDLNESPYDLQCSSQSGFCSVIDEDFNQTLTFQIEILSNFEYKIICTDNGQPPLSISTNLTCLPDDQTLVFIPIYSLIIENKIDNNHGKENVIIRNNLVDFYSNDGDKTGRQRRQANSPPQDIYFDRNYLNISENSRDLDIAHVYVNDAENDNYNCSVITDNGLLDYEPFEITDGILRTSSVVNDYYYDIDFETNPIYHLTVTCFDSIRHFKITKQFSIIVEDINEPPSELRLTPNLLPENSPSGYIIGKFETIDPDISSTNQTFEYIFPDSTGDMFRIENNQLILTRENQVDKCLLESNLCPHDYEQTNSLYIHVRVTDDGSPRISQKFWIKLEITDENDPPVDLQLERNSVAENSPIGTIIGSFSVRDQDLYQTHTFNLLSDESSQDLFYIELNNLHLAQIPNYELEKFVLINVQAIDNGTQPKNITSEFLIEIRDVDEFPTTYKFLSHIDEDPTNQTITDLLNEKQPSRVYYLPQNAYLQPTIGKIVFIFEDHDRQISLNGENEDTDENELGFTEPTCEMVTENSHLLLCTSMVYTANHRSIFDENGHLVATSLFLTNNGKTKAFPRKLQIKFENITLTIDDQPTESINIPKSDSSGHQIGIFHAVDLAANEQPVHNVTFSSDSSLSYPLEIVDSTLLKVRDDVDLSASDSPTMFNISVFVITTGDASRMLEKYLIVYVKEKTDFNLILSDSHVMENAHANVPIGTFIFEDGVENYLLDLVDTANGRFKLNGANLFTDGKYDERCHFEKICLLDYEREPEINITIAVRDPITNETIRLVPFTIQVQDENEDPYNVSLTNEFVPENATIGSVISLISAMDDDFNQTLTYTVDNPVFSTINNQLILAQQLDYSHKPSIPIIIRATDNGEPPLFSEKFFLIEVTVVNQPPYEAMADPFIVYLSPNRRPTPVYLGHMNVVDPDIKENFAVAFDYPSFRALSPAFHSYSIVNDENYQLYAHVYNIDLVDITPPILNNQTEYVVNSTANIMDSSNHSILLNITVRYILSTNDDEQTLNSTVSSLTIPSESFDQAQHIRLYETTPAYTPIIHGLVSSSDESSPICIATDDENVSFLINNTRTTFLISLPDNYTLNSTVRSEIFVVVHCTINNITQVYQEIVIDVLPAPPTVQINFNQTQPFNTNNNNNNHTILGTFSSIELTTTTSTINRTYQLELLNYRDTFQLLPNDSLIQIGSYPSDIFEMSNPHINLTVQSTETTLNEPIRIIHETFSIPIIIDRSQPFLTFSQTSIPFDLNPEEILGTLTIHNFTRDCHLHLLNTYDNGLEFNSTTKTIRLKKPLSTFPINETNNQLSLDIHLTDVDNQTILTTTFRLTIVYSNQSTDPCLNRDCGNGTCVSLENNSSYCLCTSGYTGIDCRENDFCAYNPCLNNGICKQLNSTGGDFECQCLPNYSGRICETFVDVCQLNQSLCSINETCVPLRANSTTIYTCISNDRIQYFVFDYLKTDEQIDIVNDENLPTKFQDFIQNNLFDVDNLILPNRQVLGPEHYRRAALVSVMVSPSNNTFNESLAKFCENQSITFDSFSQQICSSYQQTIELENYFQSKSVDCPDCNFTQVVDEYYWFDKVLPFLPLWITLIVGSFVLALIPFIPQTENVPKKVSVPLMKAKRRPEDDLLS